MAKLVSEVMNRKVFTVRPTDDTDSALGHLLASGINAAPVIDGEGRPLGFFSIRDGLRRPASAVAEAMTLPAHSIAESATLEAAGRVLERSNLQQAAAVDSEGRVVAVVSVFDVLRGILSLQQQEAPTRVMRA